MERRARFRTRKRCRIEGCLRPNFVRYHMVKSPSLRIRGVLQAEGTGAGEETGRALGVHVGPGLKGPIHSRNQSDLVLHPMQRLHGLGQFERMNSNWNG